MAPTSPIPHSDISQVINGCCCICSFSEDFWTAGSHEILLEYFHTDCLYLDYIQTFMSDFEVDVTLPVWEDKKKNEIITCDIFYSLLSFKTCDNQAAILVSLFF